MSVKKLFELDGKVALITGGSRGLGLQIAEALGEMGCRLALTARKPEELDKARRHLEARGVEVMTIAGNIAQFETIPGLVDQVLERYGTIDILVNNAGATWGLLWKTTRMKPGIKSWISTSTPFSTCAAKWVDA